MRAGEGDLKARLAACLLPLLLAGCGGPNLEPARRTLCEAVLTALEPTAHPAGWLPTGQPNEVRLRFAVGSLGDERLTCRFDDGLIMQGVRGSTFGELSAASFFLLQRHVLDRVAFGTGQLGPLAYFVQQLLNALAPASIYALLALGYSLLYGLIGRINLAFGEFCAFGTIAALAGVMLVDQAAGFAVPAAFLSVLPVGMALGAALSAIVAKPLVQRTPLAFLIATLGLSIALSEGMRLAQGSGDRWFPPGFVQPLALWRSGEAALTVSTAQLVAAGLACAVFAGAAQLMGRTTFGRSWRAYADDPGAAALLGVDTSRLLRRSAMLAAVCAALAGAVVALSYGVVGFDVGRLLGFKALTAAVLGGIGSPAGAVLGGVLIGLAETFWAAYLTAGWRDVMIFGVLAATLALRPHGLLGLPTARDNPMLWRGRELP
jgi:branched-chain amino acid transport system permease protein